jgi:hypothetical protein
MTHRTFSQIPSTLCTNFRTQILPMYRARQIFGILQSRADIKNGKIVWTKRFTRRFPIPSTTSATPTASTSIHATIPSSVIDSKRFVLSFSIAAMAILYEQSSTLCQRDHENDEDSAPTIDDTKDAGYDEEEKEKENCPFCRFFLESPCSQTFKVWQECVKVRNELYFAFITFTHGHVPEIQISVSVLITLVGKTAEFRKGN